MSSAERNDCFNKFAAPTFHSIEAIYWPGMFGCGYGAVWPLNGCLLWHCGSPVSRNCRRFWVQASRRTSTVRQTFDKDDLIFLWNQPAQGYVYKLWNFFIDVPQKNSSKVDSSLNYYNNYILPCPAMAAKYVESRRWRLTDARAEYGWFARWKERWGVLMLILLLLPMWLLPMCCWQLTTLSRCRFSNTKLSHGMYIEAILESCPCKVIN